MKKQALWKRLLYIVLCLSMILGMVPAILPAVEVEAATPTYITDIAIAWAGSRSNAKNYVTSKGFTLIDVDLNEDAGGKYIYMGYKTSTDPSRAITGIYFHTGKNPPQSLDYRGYTFNLLGGQYESNATGDGVVDLNDGAGGSYIYTYITRDRGYNPPLTNITVNQSSSYSGWASTATNLNQGADGMNLYLHYKIYQQRVEGIVYYVDDDSQRKSHTFYGYLRDHTQSVILQTPAPYYSYILGAEVYIPWGGWPSVELVGWRDDDTAGPPEYTSAPSVTVDTSGKVFRCVYKRDLNLFYRNDYADSAGKKPEKQTATQYLNIGVSDISVEDKTFTVTNIIPVNPQVCGFLGWTTSWNGTVVEYRPGDSITINDTKTLYPVWAQHTDNNDDVCDTCGKSLDTPKLVDGVYQICNRAQLIWFMQHVNNGNKSANAVLAADIDMGHYQWTPIGSTGLYYSTSTYPDKGYEGTFDGNGHVISNFTVKGNSGKEETYGLFGTLSGTVKNIGVDKMTFILNNAKDIRAGGIVGQIIGGKVENCFVTNSIIDPKNYVAGGIAGCNYAGTISNCYTYGNTISGNTAPRYGHIVGDNRADGGTSDRPGSVVNCYTDKTPAIGERTGTKNEVTVMTAAQFASGEVAYRLNTGVTDGTQVWYQTCGEGLPAFRGKTVYYGYTSCATDAVPVYTNNAAPATKPDHRWNNATCTAPKTCSACGKTEGNALGHDWKAATCTAPMICSVCGKTEGNALGHDWQAATCTDPKTCSVCGKTEGNALGHDWQAATCTDPKTCSVCGATEGNALGHDWQAATCTDPKTCSVCGKTEGNALGHDWQAATCAAPKTCSACGKTEGNVLEHDWQAATCAAPKTCSACGKTEGNVLEHDWQAATCAAPKTCSVCGATEGDTLDHRFASDGFCTECVIGYVPAPGAGTEESPYLIGNAAQLYWFAQKVNEGDVDAWAELTADIMVNEDVYAEGVSEDSLRGWTPISWKSQYYGGTFDGKGHTISGLYCAVTGRAGLFGGISALGIVQNVGVKNSLISCEYDTNYAGAIAGYNAGTVIGCWSIGNEVHAYYYAGGVVGSCEKGYVIDCYNIGSSVRATQACAGGVVGSLEGGTAVNCYSTGKVTCNYNPTLSGGVVGMARAYRTLGSSEIVDYVLKNCYYLFTDALNNTIGGVGGQNQSIDIPRQAEARNAEAFASGEVAYLLQQGTNGYAGDAWGQKIGTDSTPVLYGDKVYFENGTYFNTRSTITQKGRNLSYEDLIYVIDIFELIGVEGIDLTKDAGLLIWSVEEFEALAEIVFDAEHANPGLKPYRNTGYYYGSSEGIFTRDLYKEAYYVGYLKLADGSYVYSEPKLYSPAIYAYSMLSKTSTSSETKELCVALLNYISAAQMYFDKSTPAENLVNADLSDEQKALNWENISFNLAPEVSADKQVERDTNVFTGTGKNLLFEEMISIVSIFKIDDSVIADAKEYGTIYWTAEQFAALEGEPSIDNIGAGTKTGMSVYRGNAGQWYSQAPEIAAKNMADTQYFYLGYVIHADGTVSYSGVQSYTVEQYISNTVGKTSTSDEMRAFAQWLYFYERAAALAIG